MDDVSALTVAALPPVKCLGGKRKLASVLISHMPERIDRYVEPFCGGAAVFFALYSNGRLREADVVLSDTNSELISLYLAIRDELQLLIAHLRDHEERYRKQRADYYYAVRSQDPRTWRDRARTGARYIFLNKTCFNGVSRYNQEGIFNVPHGSFRSEPVICDAENLIACSRALANVDIRNEDFKEALTREERQRAFAKSQAHVVYADPPYVPLSKTSNFVGYGRAGFPDSEQVALADHLRELAKLGVHVVASNSGSPRVRELYSSVFQIYEVQAKRAVNSNTTKRGAITELIMVGQQ